MSSRKRSSIWNHFDEIEPGKKAKCLICKNIYSITNNSIGNIRRHIKTQHLSVDLNGDRGTGTGVADEELADDVTPAPTSAIPATSSSSADSHSQNPSTSTAAGGGALPGIVQPIRRAQQIQNKITSHFRSSKPVSLFAEKKLNTQLVKLITKGYYPFSLVEDIEFKKFVNLLCPGYTMPTRKTVSTSFLQQSYDTCRERVEEKLKNVSGVCLTTDCWTSINTDSFIAVSAHFLDEGDKLDSVMLGCEKFPSRHTADNIQSALLKIVTEWKIQNKITLIVTDNAANMVSAITKGLSWKHLPCFAHSLNLMVQAAWQESGIKLTIEKVKGIVEYFKRSSHASAQLKSTQKQMKLPEVKLKQDVITRWNSTLDMLKRFSKNKEAIVSTLAVLQIDSAPARNLPTLISEEWELLSQLENIFQIFQDITEEISAEKFVTVSKVLVFLKFIDRKLTLLLNDPNVTQNENLLNLVRILDKEFKSRFKSYESSDTLASSTILDPRFKKVGFRDISKYDEAVKKLKVAVTAQIKKAPPPPPPIETVVANNSVNPSAHSDMWNIFDEEAGSLIARQEPSAAGIIEVDKYLNEPLIPRQGSDPLKYWTDRKFIYPNLYQVVKTKLCNAATSVPCERIFSKTGQILTAKRSRLTDSKLSQIVFINYNSPSSDS